MYNYHKKFKIDFLRICDIIITQMLTILNEIAKHARIKEIKMITAKTRRSTFCFSKIFMMFSLALLLSFTTGAIAYASETATAPAASNDGITASEETKTDETSTEGAVTAVSAETAETTEETADALTADGVILGEGYYIDEQGQVYYDDSLVTVEEPVIVDLQEEDADEAVEEDTEDTAALLDTEEEKKADKAEDKNSQTKKEPEVKKPSYSEADLRLLSCLIYAEAGNQSYKGMLAVANVVLNRVKSDVFWHVDTIKEVIYDRKWSVQFSVTIKSKKTGLSPLDKALKCYDTGKFTGANPEAENKAMQRAIKAAKAALEGKNNIGGYLCFTYKGGSGSIKKKYPDYKIIGDHIFYRTK